VAENGTTHYLAKIYAGKAVEAIPSSSQRTFNKNSTEQLEQKSLHVQSYKTVEED
jgi:hypothetical protein